MESNSSKHHLDKSPDDYKTVKEVIDEILRHRGRLPLVGETIETMWKREYAGLIYWSELNGKWVWAF